MSVTILMILDTRRIKVLDKYPVKLRVTYQRISEYYQTVFDLTEHEWERLSIPRLSNELQAVRNKLKEIELKALAYVDGIDLFNFQEFENTFIRSNPLFRKRRKKNGEIQKKDFEFDFSSFHRRFPILLEASNKTGRISYSYLIYIKKLLREGRIASASVYHSSYVSLKKFRGDILFETITVTYLKEYENWLKNKDISKTTIGFYLRPLRAIFNEAINEHIIAREKCYPFGRRKYIIPSSRNVKKALELSDVQKIYLFKSESNPIYEHQARDYWLFSYFGNGMNPKDIANLKYRHIDGDYITFERAKTEHSQRGDPRPITVFLNADMKNIIDRWGNKNNSSDNYLFPILQQGLTPLQQYERIKNFVSFINDWMKIVIEKIGIDKNVTTYVARHTFSTVLKRSGASTEFIQEALGHSDIKTTENYLDSFDKETKREFANRLLAFKELKQEDANLF